MPKSGASTFLNHRVITGVDGYVSSHLATIKAKKDLADERYLLYALSRVRAQELLPENSYPSLNLSLIKNICIPLPSLEEQRRIVAVLDEAFEGLDRARAYAESNFDDSTELYTSTLNEVVNHALESWVRMPVSDTLTRFRVPTKVKRRDYLVTGKYPIISQESEFINGYWNNTEDVIPIERPVVIFGDHTRCFKFVDFDFVVGADGTQIMSPIDTIDPEFYYYALQAVPLEGKGYARHFTHLKKSEIAFPSDLMEQREIASDMSDLRLQTERLAREYEAILADLDDLRHSLLERTFAGELT